MTLLRVERLAKHYGETAVFRNVSLEIEAGEFVALVGESGVGKSTLLNGIAGLDTVDAGRVVLGGTEIGGLGDAERARWRREKLGFVFQAFHVLPHLSVADNVALPLWLLGRETAPRVEEMLAAVSLQDLGGRMPAQLSGGQLQRVAIARALVHRPALILADEPTGNLDPATAARVMGLFADEVARAGAACLMVTHSPAAASHARRVLRLTAAGIAGSEKPQEAEAAAEADASPTADAAADPPAPPADLATGRNPR